MNSVWIENAYNKIKEKIPDFEPDSLEVAKAVDEHRFYWKPKKVKTLLIAESHVKTIAEELETELNYQKVNANLGDCPRRYVRLVYCLGYGENQLIESRNIVKNNGTKDYWKIFASCAADTHDFFDEFKKVLTVDPISRVHNKIDLLNKLKEEKDVWLIDASVVALYGYEEKPGKKPAPKTRKKVLEICWDEHTSKIIKKEKPSKIVIIGKEVFDSLKPKVEELKIDFLCWHPQPQYLMREEKWQTFYRNYQEICNSDKPNIVLEGIVKNLNEGRIKVSDYRTSGKNSKPNKTSQNKLSENKGPAETHKRDYTKYEFEGKKYPKNRLVLAVLFEYCKYKSDITFSELKKVFPAEIQGQGLGVFTTKEKAEARPKRYFIKSEELIKLKDTTIAVCTQWYYGNIERFIKRAEELGFVIEKKY